MSIFIFSIGLLVGSVVTIFIHKTNTVSKSKHEALKTDKAIIDSQISDLKTAIIDAKNEKQQSQKTLHEVELEKAALTQDKKHLQTELSSSIDKLKKATNTENELKDTIRDLMIENSAIKREINLLKEHQKNSNEIVLSAKSEFENIANAILKAEGATFQDQAKNDIGAVITPISTELNALKTSLDSHKTTASELKGAIDVLHTQYVTLGKATDDFTNAITGKGNFKMQGTWGEEQLGRLLELSGFQNGVDYKSELTIINEDKRARPDYIIYLPEEKHLVIDSKVSLVSYMNYTNSKTEQEKTDSLSDFIKSVKSHILSLGNAAYHEISELRCPGFVFMFMPVEPAFLLAIQNLPNIHDFAWKHKVALVCPSTLFSSLKTISYLRKLERQNKNFEEIARIAGSIHDKIISFVSDSEKIQDQIRNSLKLCKQSSRKLGGSGGVISSIKKLEILGAKTKKQLPSPLEEKYTIEHAPEEELSDAAS